MLALNGKEWEYLVCITVGSFDYMRGVLKAYRKFTLLIAPVSCLRYMALEAHVSPLKLNSIIFLLFNILFSRPVVYDAFFFLRR
jgi:hypothetical protein